MKYSIYTYITLALSLIALSAGLSSCSDDNFADQEVVTTQPQPDTIAYTYVTGRVKDTDGNTLPNIDVQYLIEGQIRNVTTNQEGIYEIRQLEETVTRATLKCQGEGFLPKVEVVHINEQKAIENDIILAHENQFGGSLTGEFAAQSLSDSLLSISGRLIDGGGDGVANIYVYLVDFSFSTFIYAITDADGYFTFATKPLPQATLLAGSQCQSIESLIDLLVIEEDLELEDKTTSIVEPTIVKFSGFITDCFTEEGLISGEVQFQFQGNDLIRTADITNGEYFIDLPLCLASDCVDVTIYSYISQIGRDTLLCQEFTLGTNVIDYEVCNTGIPTDNDGSLTYTLGDITTTYPLVEVEETATNYSLVAADFETLQGFVFITDGKETSGSTQTSAVVNLATSIASYISEPGDISYQIDSTDTNFMYGTFAGQMLEGTTGVTVPIEGEFKALIK